MNRGFNYYFREGVNSSVKSLYHNKDKGVLRFIVYLLMELIGRLAFLLNPLFDLSNVRQGQLVWQKNRVDISASFKEAGSAHALWTYILTVCVEALLFLAGLVLIALFTALLGGIGYGVGILAGGRDLELFFGLFCIPGGIVLLVYFVIMPLLFAPTPYIVATNKGIGVGETLSACFHTMKQCGKWTLFLNNFIPSLINGLIIGVVGLCTRLLSNALVGSNIFFIIMPLWFAVMLVGLMLAVSVFELARRSANHHLFFDIVLDPVRANKTSSGINLKKCKGKLFSAEEGSENLASLFEENAPDPYAIYENRKPAPQAEPLNLSDAIEPPAQKQAAATPKDLEPVKEPEPVREPEKVPEPVTESESVKVPVKAPEPVKEPEPSPEEDEEEPFVLETVSGILGEDSQSDDDDRLWYGEGE